MPECRCFAFCDEFCTCYEWGHDDECPLLVEVSPPQGDTTPSTPNE